MMDHTIPPLASSSGPSISLPLDLYTAMAACFYGGGPTYWELRGKPQPWRPARPAPEQIPEDTSPPEEERFLGQEELNRKVSEFGLRPYASRPGHTPRGAAARHLAPLEPTLGPGGDED